MVGHQQHAALGRDVLAAPRTGSARRASPSGRRRPRRTRSRSRASPAARTPPLDDRPEPAVWPATRPRMPPACRAARPVPRRSRCTAMVARWSGEIPTAAWTSSFRSSRWTRPSPGCAARPTAAWANRPRTPGWRWPWPTTRWPRRGPPGGCGGCSWSAPTRWWRPSWPRVGVEVVPDGPAAGLNARLRAAAPACCGSATRRGAVGALQADLPALRPAELDAAVRPRWRSPAARGGRSCADAGGHRHHAAARRARRAAASRGSGSARRAAHARLGRAPAGRRLAGPAPRRRHRRRSARAPPNWASARTPVRAGAEPALLTRDLGDRDVAEFTRMSERPARSLPTSGGSQSPTWVTT